MGDRSKQQQVDEIEPDKESSSSEASVAADDGLFKANDGQRSLPARELNTTTTTRPAIRRREAHSNASTNSTTNSSPPARRQSSQISAKAAANIIKRILVNNNEQQVSGHKRPTGSTSTSSPLIHTDQLNATTRLLFVHAPPLSHLPRQVLAMTSSGQLDDRNAHLESYQAAESSAAPTLTGDQQLVARLDVLNLQVSSSAATLTWTVNLHPSASVLPESHHLVEPERSSGPSTLRVRRDEHSAADDDDLPERDREKDENYRDLRRRKEASREHKNGDDDEEEANKDHDDYQQGEHHRRLLLDKSTTAPDLLRHRANVELSPALGGAGVRPLPASRQPVRRPPARVVQVIPSNGTMATSTSTSTTRPPQRTSSRPTSSRRPKNDPSAAPTSTSTTTTTTSSTPSPSLQTLNEPPMPRVPSVQINRIVQPSSTTTLRPQKLTGRQGKSLQAEEAKLNQTTSTTTTTTTSTTTTTTTTTSTTPSPAIEREDSESTIRSVRVTKQPDSRQEQQQQSASTKSPPPRTPTSSTTESPVIITTHRHQLITGNQLEGASTASKARPPLEASPSSPSSPKPRQAPKETPATEKPRHEAQTSRWLVRLRRFASNEVDIVQVVVNNLQVRTSPLQQVTRQISFKDLEPSSGYEICVESGQLNQQLGDKYHVLNANHFLKCQDVSDVELSSPSIAGQANNHNSSLTMRRMDLIKRTDETNIDLGTLNETSQEAGPRNKGQLRVKSLCREFFTLPASSTLNEVNFGQLGSSEEQSQLANLLELGAANSTGLRRPKSLINQTGDRNALKSHMELMEIDDALNDRQRLFEMPTNSLLRAPQLRPNNNNNNAGRIHQPEAPAFALGGDSSTQINTNVSSSIAPIGRPGSSPQLDYLSSSILPIIGCVFVLVFIATLANMILNVMNLGGGRNKGGGAAPSAASSSSSFRRRLRRHRSPTSQLSRPAGLLSVGSMSGRHLASASSGAGLNSTMGLGQPGSGYYSGSEHSGTTSQTRIVVVGDHCEPFAASSGYFDLPLEQQPAYGRGQRAARVRRSDSSQSSDELEDGQPVGKQTSAYLLSDAARFPLGPSFEGDEKHNADMVGLARRNYDNFINNIYNDHVAADELSNAELHSNRASTASKLSPAHLVRDCAKHERAATSFQQTGTGQVEEQADEAMHGGPSNGQRQRHQLRHRIRFDKVNPIYNMDAINQPPACSRTVHCRPLSSFQNNGNPSSCQQQQDVRPCKMGGQQVAGATEQGESRCELCEGERERHQQEQDRLCGPGDGHSNCSHNQQPANSDTTMGATGAGCQHELEQPYFKCCLDRQKQRFHAQQQQLERVVNKNGSLVPQPFINNTPAMEPLEQEAPGQEAASKEPRAAQGEDSMVSLASSMSVTDNSLATPSNGLQVDRALNELHTGPKETFVFGENLDRGRSDSPPPPPPPPLKEPATVVGASASNSSSLNGPGKAAQKPLVNLVSSAPVSRAANDDETIDKKDFNRRRSELESKLYLPGMTKQ